jgi:hypothetical protein
MAKVIVSDDFMIMMVIENGVGLGRANNIDDVVLIQYMLNIWIQHQKTAYWRQRSGLNDSKPLIVDGLFGPRTGRRILQFQNYCNKNAIPVIPDGRVDIIPAGATLVSQSKKINLYTMAVLNSHIEWMFGGFMVFDLIDLYYKNDFPARLIPMVRRYIGQTAVS